MSLPAPRRITPPAGRPAPPPLPPAETDIGGYPGISGEPGIPPIWDMRAVTGHTAHISHTGGLAHSPLLTWAIRRHGHMRRRVRRRSAISGRVTRTPQDHHHQGGSRSPLPPPTIVGMRVKVWRHCPGCGVLVHKLDGPEQRFWCTDCGEAAALAAIRQMMEHSGPAWEAWQASNAKGSRASRQVLPSGGAGTDRR